MNSPQSQKDAVGSMVERYVTALMRNTTAATTLFQILNFFLSISFVDVEFANITIFSRIFAG